MKRRLLLAAMLLLLSGCGAAQPAEPPASMAAYPETTHLRTGDSEVIQVVLTPEGSGDQKLIWASSDQSVAVVDEAGMVSAIAPGTCTVTVASSTNSRLSCRVQVIVDQEETKAEGAAAAEPDQPAETYVTYVPETNAAMVYPTTYLSEAEVEAMDNEQLQFLINQIYAKNGYVFRSREIQDYFTRMPWYTAVSNDASRLELSSLDRSNLNLLVRQRESRGKGDTSPLGWIWTRQAVERPLRAEEVSSLSSYDIQLLINTIYAKNGYVFARQELQDLFQGQSWYCGWVYHAEELTFSEMDEENLQLLLSYR